MKPMWTRRFVALALIPALGLASLSGAAADNGDAQVVAPAIPVTRNGESAPQPQGPSAPVAADTDGVDFVRGAGAAFFVSRDNENFSTQRVAVEYLPRYEHLESLTGMRYTYHHYGYGDWSSNAQQLAFLHRDVDPRTAKGWQLEAGLYSQGGHDLLTADGFYRASVSEGTGVELVVNREVVETVNALADGVYFTLAGAGVEQKLTPHVTVVALGARQAFSDGNNRDHARLRLIVQPNLDLGLTLQMRYRTYTSSAISLTYFNPSHYDESMLALGWRQRMAGWTASLTAGAGEQHVADDPATPTRLLELAFQNPASRDYSLRVSGGMNQSASFNGPDYRYSYLQGEWILKF